MRKLTIVIDAGHGGHDPGAIGKFTKEKDNVLRVALRLKSILEAAGHKVILTRSTDIFLSLSERAAKAGAWGADIFLSLHNNSAVSSASGFETFIFNGSTVSKASIALQKSVHTAIANKIGIHDRGMKRGNFSVLRETTMPAVLIEYAFISHKDDEQILINKVEQLAQWTAEGIVTYTGGKLDQASKPVNKPQPTRPKPSPPKPTKTPMSLVDYLKSRNINSSFANREKLALQHGIKNYSGTAAQNTALLDKVTSGSVVNKPALGIKGDQKTKSVVDYLKSIGQSSSFANRNKLALKFGVKNYKGTPTQNVQLLKKLRG